MSINLNNCVKKFENSVLDPLLKDPNQAFGACQSGDPPEKAEHSPKFLQEGYPSQGNNPTAPPPEVCPPPSYEQAIGFTAPPLPFGVGQPHTAGEHVPLSNRAGTYGFSPGNVADEEVKTSKFSDRTIRRYFIRKIYSILSVQFIIALSIIVWLFCYQPAKHYLQDHIGLYYFSVIILLVTIISVAYCDKLRRKSPDNYYLLFIFTLVASFYLACSVSMYEQLSVFMAVGVTLATCLAITLFTFFSNWDFTSTAGLMFIGTTHLAIFFFTFFFLDFVMVVQLTCASLGSLLFSFYLMIDTQIMMGERRKHLYSISPEEYIFAVLNLYVDGINYFRNLCKECLPLWK